MSEMDVDLYHPLEHTPLKNIGQKADNQNDVHLSFAMHDPLCFGIL